MRSLYIVPVLLLVLGLVFSTIIVGATKVTANANENSCREPTACFHALCANGDEVNFCGPEVAFWNKVRVVCGS